MTSALQTFLLAGKSERIVVVPTTGPSFWVEQSQGSDNYIEQMGVFLSDLILNRTPADVAYRNKIILKHIHPRSYHQIKRLLVQDIQNVIKQDQSYIFKPETSSIDPQTLSFITEGESLVLIGKPGKQPTCASQQKKRFTFRFQMQNGRLLLKSLIKEDLS